MDLLNDILSAVSVKLCELYPELDIFSEEVPNELPKTCFILGFAGSATVKKEYGRRFCAYGSIDISYYVPKHSSAMCAEFNKVFLDLSLNLQRVTFGDTSISLFGHKRNVTDDVLHDVCDFKTFIYADENAPLIEEVDFIGSTGKG